MMTTNIRSAGDTNHAVARFAVSYAKMSEGSSSSCDPKLSFETIITVYNPTVGIVAMIFQGISCLG